jgi:hypothetical protein
MDSLVELLRTTISIMGVSGMLIALGTLLAAYRNRRTTSEGAASDQDSDSGQITGSRQMGGKR